MKIQSDKTLTLVGNAEFLKERQNEFEIVLRPGRYVILPLTTGGLMRKPESE